ncbi:peptidylprolyl isomerase [Paenibacillus psychroresistens]|uniref:peptidylprolyl isomerase n=1 Tax=Paenibacillus psychroresistens TaxID=1778678 RepID=UPI0018776712|nr:peptidylprolyl isomerase [Paenibacillus psychroresistens]
MKDKLKGLVIGLLIGVLACSSVVYAAAGTKIEVFYNNLKYIIDGVEQAPTVGKGFIYEGTTYVPLRFVGESMGKPVSYDSKSETVYVGRPTYTEAPAMVIDPKKKYKATMITSKGTITIDLFAKDAPLTVNNFFVLSNSGFYNDILFHRIMESFMVQAGDPEGTGAGGPGYTFKDELKNGHKYEPGTLAMANAGPDTNGSQFFICTGADCAQLNELPNYSIFGKVSKGMDVLQTIAKTPVQESAYGEMSDPTYDVKILSIKVEVTK